MNILLCSYLLILIFSVKPFETCIMGANDDLDGKTTHLNWFLHTNNKGTKMSQTSYSCKVIRFELSPFLEHKLD